jgi:hypothetical protein
MDKATKITLELEHKEDELTEYLDSHQMATQ